MFLTPAFAQVRPDYLSERFLRISQHLGLPRIRFHDLRHTYATIALASGVPIHVVSERLGNMNSSVTLNVSHVMPGMQADAAQSIADYVTSSTTSSPGHTVIMRRRSPTGDHHTSPDLPCGPERSVSRLRADVLTACRRSEVWI